MNCGPQVAPKTTQDRPQIDPRASQERLFFVFVFESDFWSILDPSWLPKWLPLGTLWAPSWRPKSMPKSIKIWSRKKIAPREPQDAPRAPLGGTGTPQEVPGRPQEAPRRLPGRPQSRKSERNECVLASFLDNASLRTTPTPGERPVTRRRRLQ